RHPFARRIIEHDRIVPVRALLQDNARITVFITRFMPGFRMALYSACGFFAVPFRRFLPVSILSAIVWTTLLFTLSFWYGFYTIHELGFWRWPVLALILSGFFLFGHRYWKKVTTVQAEPA
ncbi:MAG TPA: VTT domain-containing protein, partial [Candidatus Paceibacterota bacterium]